jgi:DeoR/GlpR family transcriptional regulator of sugar metabolism
VSEGLGVRRATKARHDAMVDLVRGGEDSVEVLSKRLGVSASTVRRDLATLQRDGRLARTYGGALVREVFQERPFNESEQLNVREKSAIAAAAVDLVPAGGTVFLDAGTTCLALAHLLVDKGPLTVVTRGLEAALALSAVDDVDVLIVGGRVQPRSHGVVGPLSAIALDRHHFDVAFLGADAVDPVRGLGEPTVDETWVKERATAVADRVVLLADASKLAQRAPAWVPLGQSWTVVMDAGAPDEVVAQLRARGVHVHVA